MTRNYSLFILLKSKVFRIPRYKHCKQLKGWEKGRAGGGGDIYRCRFENPLFSILTPYVMKNASRWWENTERVSSQPHTLSVSFLGYFIVMKDHKKKRKVLLVGVYSRERLVEPLFTWGLNNSKFVIANFIF